jgi:hypothetical protein
LPPLVTLLHGLSGVIGPLGVGVLALGAGFKTLGAVKGVASSISAVSDALALMRDRSTPVGGALSKVKSGMGLAAGAAGLVGGALGGVTLALGVGLAAWSHYQQRQAEAKARVDAMTDSLDQQNGALTDNSTALAVQGLRDYADGLDWIPFRVGNTTEALQALNDEINYFGDNIGIPTEDLASLTKTMMGGKDAVEDWAASTNKALKRMIGDHVGAIDGVNLLRDAMLEQIDTQTTAQENWQTTNAAMEAAGVTTASLTSAQDEAATATSSYADEIDRLAGAVDQANQQLFSHGNATLAADASYRSLLDTVSAVAQGTSGVLAGGFDIATDAGRRNAEVIDSLIRESQTYYQALVDQGVPQADINTKMGEYSDKIKTVGQSLGGDGGATWALDRYNSMVGTSIAATQQANQESINQATALWLAAGAADGDRAALEKVLTQTGMTREEMGRYIATLYGVPDQVVTTAIAQGTDAVNATLNWVARNRPSYVTQYISRVITDDAQLKAQGYKAGGGSIWGPGTGTSDSIPAMLSNGEFVIRAAVAQKWRRLLDYLNTTGSLPGGLPKFASGGLVNTRLATPNMSALAASLTVQPVVVQSAPSGAGSSDGPATVGLLQQLVEQGRAGVGLPKSRMTKALVDLLVPGVDQTLAS